MIFGDGIGLLLITGLWIFCIVDVITTPDGAARNLPKIAWLIVVILLFDIGSLAWLIAGKPWGAARVAPRGAAARFPEYDRPGRHVPSNPDDDEVFLAGLRARAEEQRRRARETGAADDRPVTPEDEPPTAR